jgi:uncharacterized protein YkwD
MNTPKPTGLSSCPPANLALLLLVGLTFPEQALAQRTEHEDVEIIRPPAKRAPLGPSPDLSQVAKLIVEKTNQFRRQEDLSTVEVNPKLAKAAEAFAGYMARTNRFGHMADGSRPADRASKQGYEYCIVAENITYEYSSGSFTAERLAENFFQGWKKSTGHRKNMLDPDVSDTGVAVARAEDIGYYYAVQMFGRPRSKSIEFEVANESDAPAQYVVGGHEFSLAPRHTRIHRICRPAELTLKPPEGKGSPTAVQPANGDHYVITREERGFRLTKG